MTTTLATPPSWLTGWPQICTTTTPYRNLSAMEVEHEGRRWILRQGLLNHLATLMGVAHGEISDAESLIVGSDLNRIGQWFTLPTDQPNSTYDSFFYDFATAELVANAIAELLVTTSALARKFRQQHGEIPN